MQFSTCLLYNLDFIISFFILNTGTEEEKKALSETNAPHFTISLKDTEVLENTYLTYMVQVKGDPNPRVRL